MNKTWIKAQMNPRKKQRRTADENKQVQFVLPDRKTVSLYKFDKALQQEISAVESIIAKKPATKITWHFDSTSRSRVQGDWPSLILNFINDDDPKENKMHRLRAIFFAYEDREQIVKLFVETLKRLSVASDGQLSPVDIWESIDAIMTNAASKNLEIGKGVAKLLYPDKPPDEWHIPKHLLCKSHVCEKLEESCTKVCKALEQKLNIKEIIVKKQPPLKSFLNKSSCVARGALDALIKLASHQSSGKTVSLAKEFDLILEERGKAKSFSLYVEKRFTRFGHAAGATLDCYPEFTTILDRTHLDNSLIKACKIYLNCEYIQSALTILAYFTYKVTMPYLNCIEKSNQKDLVTILPKLYKELLKGNCNVLSDYHIEWTHVHMKNHIPETDFEKYMLKELCHVAAEGIKLQCAREYWGDSQMHKRATEIFNLSDSEIKSLPTENLETERYLAKFGWLASQSAARSNKNFKAQRIRDDLMFETKKRAECLDKKKSEIFKKLKAMELNWTDDQKQQLKVKIRANLEKQKHINAYAESILKKCKSHHGPFTTIDELTNYVNTKPKDIQKNLRHEIIFKRQLNYQDFQIRPSLYKVNRTTVEELITNLN